MTLQNNHGIPRVGFGLCKIRPRASDSVLKLPVVTKKSRPLCRGENLQFGLALFEAGKQGIYESNRNRQLNDPRQSSDAAFNNRYPVYD
jgi:hypothetical protein